MKNHIKLARILPYMLLHVKLLCRSNVKMVSRSVECNYLVEVFQILSELKFGKGAWWDLENFKMFSDDL